VDRQNVTQLTNPLQVHSCIDPPKWLRWPYTRNLYLLNVSLAGEWLKNMLTIENSLHLLDG
jgi:hypothetical protein